jgi:multicomponent Na+:H+ antiporter subunit G
MEGTLVWAVDALVVLGVLLLGIAVFGMLWLPDLYTRLHAASKGGFVGTFLIVLAALVSGSPGMFSHGLLILVFLVLTAPISSHAIGRAAWLAREPMAEEIKDSKGSQDGEDSQSR